MSLVEEIIARLIKIKSVNPPGNERLCADEVQKILSENSISSIILDCGNNRANIISSLCIENPKYNLVFYGHMDVVDPGMNWDSDPFEVMEKDSKLYGRGACDMKGGLAAMLAAYIRLHHSKDSLKGNVSIVFTCDEETANLGFRELQNMGYFKSDLPIYAIVGEPSNRKIAIGHLGVERFWIEFKGKCAHSSKPECGINAIENASRLIPLISDYNVELRKIKTDVGSPSAAVTLISGGTKENIIPDFCKIMIDRRTVYGESCETVSAELNELIKKAGLADYATVVPYFTLNSALVQKTSNFATQALSILKSTDPAADFSAFEAGCEQGLLMSAGVKALIYGPGDLKMAHMPNEFVTKQDLQIAESFYYDMAISFDCPED